MSSWFTKKNLRIYLCQAMTGLKQDVIFRNNKKVERTMQKYGITVLSPVSEEGIQPISKTLPTLSPERMKYLWKRDKWLIRQSHVLLDITGPSLSQGSLHEIGYARYHIFMPIMRIMTVNGPSVAIEEEDIIVKDVEEAAQMLIENFGTPWKRLKWQFKLLLRCFFPFSITRINWFFNWV